MTTNEQPQQKEAREITKAEKLLLPVALLIAILYDRLCYAPFWEGFEPEPDLYGVFWFCYLALFYLFYWKKIAQSRISWYVAGCSAALCVWMLFFDFETNIEYGLLTYLVIPAVLMAHAQFSLGDYTLKEASKIALAWLQGWFIKPFSGLPVLFVIFCSLVLGENKSTAKKAALGVGITLPVVGIIIPLLMGADQVFEYYTRQILGSWDIVSLVKNVVVVTVVFMLFYSFLWNTGLREKEKAQARTKPALRIDAMICHIVLGAVCLLYVLFCAVQFTYLFAGAGLPGDMTYSEYAWEGFAQTVAVCALNLLIFGVFLQFGGKKKTVFAFLAGLLGLTTVMLFSGFIRLKLYIDAYGLTWLRILSAWFIIYLAAVIVVCVVRMLRAKIPAIALCALILLGWYTALGYANPDALAERYNRSYHYDLPLDTLG
jgi:hypothetical protein